MKISKKLWIPAVVIWLAIIVLKLTPDAFWGDCLYALDGYETKTFSSNAVTNELLPEFSAKKKEYGFVFMKISQKSTYGMIYLCNTLEVEKFRPCIVGRHKEKPNTCTELTLTFDGIDHTFISCAQDEVSVVMHVFEKPEVGCKNLYSQANLLSEKYLGKEFPSCIYLKEERENSNPNLIFDELA